MFEAGEDVPETALQRIARKNDARARMVVGEYGHVASGARQRLRSLNGVERHQRVRRAMDRDVLVLAGDEAQIVETRRTHASFQLSNTELDYVVLRLEAFACQSLRLRRCGNEFGQSPCPDPLAKAVNPTWFRNTPNWPEKDPFQAA